MNKTAERFKAEIIKRIDEVTDGQEDAIHEAATIFADTIERGGIIRAFGSGHSFGNA
ncbi:MAG: SIS domain-containing protein, partial [Collinsella aerofaciens]|nr:SIS domain-containing protein [Collinsella aerofaciens]